MLILLTFLHISSYIRDCLVCIFILCTAGTMCVIPCRVYWNSENLI